MTDRFEQEAFEPGEYERLQAAFDKDADDLASSILDEHDGDVVSALRVLAVKFLTMRHAWQQAKAAPRSAVMESLGLAHNDHPLRHFDKTCPACHAEAQAMGGDDPYAKGYTAGVKKLAWLWQREINEAAPRSASTARTNCPRCGYPGMVQAL